MANLQLKIAVTAPAAVWIAIDDVMVTLYQGQAAINLGPGNHTLEWWFRAANGTKLAIEGKVGDLKVINVGPVTYPYNGEKLAIGAIEFTVPS